MNSNRVVFVTGGTRGIGYEFVNQYLAKGDRVAVFARNPILLDAMKKQFAAFYPLKMLTFKGDVTQFDEVKKTVAQVIQNWGTIDIAIANAGQALIGPADELQVNHIHNQMNVNFCGAVNTAYAVRPYLVASKGIFVSIGSVCAYIASPMTPAYSASKAAIKYFFDAEREAFANVNIEIVQLLPGTIESDILHVRPDNVYDPRYNNPSVSDAAKWIKPIKTNVAVNDMISAIESKTNEEIITSQGKLSVSATKHFPSFLNYFAERDFKNYIAKRDKKNFNKIDLPKYHSLKNKIVFVVGYDAQQHSLINELIAQGAKISFLVNDAVFQASENILVNVGDPAKSQEVTRAVNQTINQWQQIDFCLVKASDKVMHDACVVNEIKNKMQNNFGAVVNVMYAAIDFLSKTCGSFVIIAEQSSFIIPNDHSAYSASVMAIRAFINSARISFEGRGVSSTLLMLNADDSKNSLNDMMIAIKERKGEVILGLESKSAKWLTCHSSLFAVNAAKEVYKKEIEARQFRLGCHSYEA